MNIITLDFETFFDRAYSLSKLTIEQYVRDPQFEIIGVSVKVNNQAPRWFSGSMFEIAVWLCQFDIRNNFLLCHHTAFDGFILSHHFRIVPQFYFDTLSMAKPKHAMGVGVSLKAQSEFYNLGEKGDDTVWAKGLRRADFTPWQLTTYGAYCCNDSDLTYKLFNVLRQDFPRSELAVIDMLLRMFTEPVLRLNQDTLCNHLKDVLDKKRQMVELLGQLCTQKQLMSGPQLAALLESYNVAPPMKVSPATGNPTYAFAKTDLEFKELLDHEDIRVQTVVAGRLGLKSTIEETRTTRFIGISERGLLPVPIAYYAGHTGRAGGTDDVNLQNLTRNGPLRQSIEAPEGHVIVAGDSSQIEARLLAWVAMQVDLLEDFARGVDVYSNLASRLYARPINRTFPEDMREGFVGKTCILSLGFGIGSRALQTRLKNSTPSVNLTESEAVQAVHIYRSTYKKIWELWNIGERALLAIYKGEELRFGPGGLLYTSKEGIHLPNGMMLRYPHLTYNNGWHSLTGMQWPNGFAYAKNKREVAAWVAMNLTNNWDLNLLTPIYGAKVIENVVQALARIVVFDQMLEVGKYLRSCQINEYSNVSLPCTMS